LTCSEHQRLVRLILDDDYDDDRATDEGTDESFDDEEPAKKKAKVWDAQTDRCTISAGQDDDFGSARKGEPPSQRPHLFLP
jgi:hypothetical protein